jgi:hypothetical protein
MTIISELFNDAKFILSYRIKVMKSQKALDAWAPRAGDLAPDFTLSDISGEESVTLFDFHGKKPVALVFGSYT